MQAVQTVNAPSEKTLARRKKTEETLVKAAGAVNKSLRFGRKVLSAVYHTPFRVLDKAPAAVVTVAKTIGQEAKRAFRDA